MHLEFEFELDPSLPPTVRRSLGEYRESVYTEMYYLRDKGGRRNRIVNGERVRREKTGSIYCFDMESELFLSDDAPISVEVGGRSVRGQVVACEDFQITLSLEEDLGETVSSAFIRADPWKLLQALNDRLKTMSNAEHRIAVRLMQEGPVRATKWPISRVDVGQNAAKAHVREQDITLIWGPPGTGKTYTMAEIAISYILAGKSVLAVSHSNVSVDGIVLKVAELMRERGLEKILWNAEVLRFGHVRDEALDADEDLCAHRYAISCNPELKDELVELGKRRGELRQEDARTSRELAGVQRRISEVRTAIRTSGESQPLQDELDTLKRGRQELNALRAQISDEMVGIQKRTSQIRKAVNEDEMRAVDHARMVATTASKMYANSFFEGRKYDLVLFDEVSMAYVPQIICAAMHTDSKLVLVGDFRQLAPITSSGVASKLLSKDIFSYLGITDGTQKAHYHPWLVMLDEQRRMHPAIAAFPSVQFYDHLLRDHESVVGVRDDIAAHEPCPGSAMVLVDMRGAYCASARNADNSRFNILGAVVSFSLALAAVGDGAGTVGVIAPYIAQVRLIRAMIKDYQEHRRKAMPDLSDVACSTVHQFQGSERDVIVLDTVESYPATRPGILTYKNENGSVDRLVNVAVTRARGKLLTVANESFWGEKTAGKANAFGKLCDHQYRHDKVVSANNGGLGRLLRDYDLGPNIEVFDTASAEDALIADLGKVTKRIVISIPDGRLTEPFAGRLVVELRRARSRGVEVLCKCFNYDALNQDWKAISWQSNDAVFPLVVLDGMIYWYGMPPSKMAPPTKDGLPSTTLETPIRITGFNTANMIWSLAKLDQRKSDEATQSLQEKRGTTGPNDDGKAAYGLAQFVKEHEKCPKCRGAMTMVKNRRGVHYLRCSGCGAVEYLTKQAVNHYMCVKYVRCPTCGGTMTACRGKFGVFVMCDKNSQHTFGPDQI